MGRRTRTVVQRELRPGGDPLLRPPRAPYPGGIPHLADWVVREAYSRECSSCGFWPGSGAVKPSFVVHGHPEILSEVPVFAGTRVPARNLLDYLEGGDTLDDFLDDFPTVSREQAVAFLEQTTEAFLAVSREMGTA